MQDLFTYTASNINNHAPTTGTGVWTTFNVGTGSAIASTGTQANLICSGTVGSGSQAIASYPFVPAANTLYSLNITYRFNGPVGANAPWNWVGFGFSSINSGPSWPQNTAPWTLIPTQLTGTSTSNAQFHTPSSTGHCTITAASFLQPITATITWNTSTGESMFFINGVYQYTGTTAVPSGQFYATVQAMQTGSDVSVQNITLTAQNTGLVQMQDSFDYTASDVNNHAPDMTSGGWGKWTTYNVVNGSAVASTGTQANLICSGGVGGGGQAIASYPFVPCANTFYTLRIAYKFNGPVGANAPWNWVGFGFSSINSGPSWPQNTAPWTLIPTQLTGTSTSNAQFHTPSTTGHFYIPASWFSQPITATITWNTSTGEAKYYLNDYFLYTGTTAMPVGQFYATVQAMQTGTDVSVQTIALTAQPLQSLPEVWLAPQSQDLVTNFSTIVETGTTPCSWPTAKSHTQVFNAVESAFCPWPGCLNQTQWTALIQYLKQNNIKLAVACQPLLKGTNNGCNNIEGFENPPGHTQAAQDIAAAGGTPDYLALDNALVAIEYTNSTGTCPNVSIATAAQWTANTIAIYKSYFPNIKVIDLDGMAGFPAADVQSFWADLKADLGGKPLDGMINDYNQYFNYPGQLPALAAICASAGIPYGLFWDGFCGVAGADSGSTDPAKRAAVPTQFALGMTITMQCFNAAAVPPLPTPARICVATWTDPVMTTCPETTNTNLAALMNYSLTSPYVLQAPPVALYSVWNTASYYTNYTSSYAQWQTWTAAGGGYNDTGILGGMAQNPNCGIQGLSPIYLYSNTSLNPVQYALSTSAADSDLSNYGFTRQGTLGYVFPAGAGISSGGVPLYAAHKYVGSVNQYAYRSYPYSPYYNNNFDPNNGYWALVNNGNPVAYMLPGFLHHDANQH